MNVEWLLRVILAAGCGALIGYERAIKLKSAGIRTHIIVAIGAALTMIVSKYGFADILGHPGVALDPSRVAAQVISGISFIGAGTILIRGSGVNGLTTAAGVWATAAVGLAIGAGLYFVGIASSALIILVQYVVRQDFLLNYIFRKRHFHCQLILKNEKIDSDEVCSGLEQEGFKKTEIKVHKITDQTINLEIDGVLDQNYNIDDVLWEISRNPQVIEVKRED
ncbi:MgtC/SapB family protein [Xylocopilactobacillus apicola]|uniref:Methyltransferase n=1 Tax=Xylocopilactobacillus apicola TaxID=2932184 RepID=A0AAU9D7X5_9LACO|nr:MgtC/SapB family protein [Xylocopilactobacillus apicola]BDR59653.1 methyltransferase [Xylocopilactobacillus apicola]